MHMLPAAVQVALTGMLATAFKLPRGVGAVGIVSPYFNFSNVHGDGMVLQSAPKQASVWGLCPPGDSVTLTLDGGKPLAASVGEYLGVSTFSAVLPATSSSLATTHSIRATSKITGAALGCAIPQGEQGGPDDTHIARARAYITF